MPGHSKHYKSVDILFILKPKLFFILMVSLCFFTQLFFISESRSHAEGAVISWVGGTLLFCICIYMHFGDICWICELMKLEYD